MSGNNWFLLIAGLVLSSVLAMAGARKMSAPLPKYKSPLLEEQTASVSTEVPSADKAGKAVSKKTASGRLQSLSLTPTRRVIFILAHSGGP